MMSKETYGVLGLVAAAVGGYFLVKTVVKVNKAAQKLDLTLDELESKADVEIKQSVIDAAVERKAAVAADKAVSRAVGMITTDIEADARKKISKAVDKEYENIEQSVKDKIASEIKDLNIEKTRQEVIKAAKEQAAKKFETDLDTVLEKYNANLDKVTNIYSSIAQKMNPSSNSSFTF